MRKILLLLVCLFYLHIPFSYSQILPERDRAVLVDKILSERFKRVLPDVMSRSGIDMWVLITREYNEDPVVRTMLPATWLNARRRTMLVFYWDEDRFKLEKLAVARYNIGDNITSAWDKEKEPDQWKALMELITKYNPQKIGLNYSDSYGIADGISKTDYELLIKALPEIGRAHV